MFNTNEEHFIVESFADGLSVITICCNFMCSFPRPTKEEKPPGPIDLSCLGLLEEAWQCLHPEKGSGV